MRRLLATLVIVAGLCISSVSWPAEQYVYDTEGRVTQVTYANGGVTSYSYDPNGNILAIVSSLSATGVEGPAETGARYEFRLGQNMPNPGAGLMMVRFSIARRGRVTLRVFDVQGRLVMTPVDTVLGPGEFSAKITASRLSGGVYYYKLESDGKSLTRRLAVLP